MTRIAILLGLFLIAAGHGHAEPGTHKVLVGLQTLNGKIHVYATQISASDAFRIESNPRYRANVIARAKRWYARSKVRYSLKNHGKAAWKIIPGLRTVGVQVVGFHDFVSISELIGDGARFAD